MLMRQSLFQREFLSLLEHFNIWFTLGLYDIKQRYRRSLIGPLWITLSTGVMVGSVGLMFSVIFKSSINEFLPYFAVGQVLWLFVSTQLNDACMTFVTYQSIIKQMSLPLLVHVMRKLWDNLILFAHNFLIVVFVLILFRVKISWMMLLAIPAFCLVILVLLMVSLLLAIVCTRFRDITQVVGVFIQLSYFFTPIFWMKKALPGKYSWVSDLNPFYHMIEIVRAPLLGQSQAGIHWIHLLIYLIITGLAVMYFLKLFRHRVAYWL
ncbi:MAG TPA: ABC transporter permease [Smithellaceae bacterium]|nr:ABC transporter permease [Smithellaceae bacterium]